MQPHYGLEGLLLAASPGLGGFGLVVEALDGDTGAFRRLWLAAGRPSTETGPPSVFLAGRRDELSLVVRHLVSGPADLLVVTGEAGIGKSHLLRAAVHGAGTEVFGATGTCLPLATEVPLLPVADALRAVYLTDDGRWLAAALGDCAPYVPGALRRVLPEVDLLVATGPEPVDEWSQHRLFTAVEATLAALHARRPMALAIEDLHWADSATLDLLDHMLASRRATGVRLVGTFRTDDPAAPASWLARVRTLPQAMTLALAPLSRAETEQQLAQLSHGSPDPALVEQILRRSEGHPLFVEQLAAQAHDRPEDQRLPALLADLLDARLSGLGDPAWIIVKALGTADRGLTVAQLRAVTSLDPAGLTTGLRELEDRRLLVGGGRDVGLRHPLLAEAVRRRMVAAEIVDEHARMAAALLGWAKSSPAEIAAHWKGAGEDALELTWRIKAAHAARERFAARQELEQWLRVLELWPASGESVVGAVTLCQAYCCAIDAAGDAGDGQHAARLAADAMARLPDVRGLDAAELYSRAGSLQGIAHDMDAALALLETSLAIYDELPPAAGHVAALEAKAGLLRSAGRRQEVPEVVRKALTVSVKLANPILVRRMTTAQAVITLDLGQPDRGFELLDEARAMTLTVPDPMGDIWQSVVHTNMLLTVGGSAAVIEAAADPGLACAADWQIESFRTAQLRANVAHAWIAAGNADRGASLIDPVTDAPLVLDQWPAFLERAGIEILRGRLDDAAERFALLAALPLSAAGFRASIAHLAAECDLWRGEPRLALERLVRALDETRHWPGRHHVSGMHTLAARAAADLAEPERGQLLPVIRGLDPGTRTGPSRAGPQVDTPAHEATWEAELTRLAGRSSPDHWLTAAIAWDRLTRPHRAAYCRWRAAEPLQRDGRSGKAAALRRRAAHDARGHVPLLAAIEAARGLTPSVAPPARSR